MQLSHRLKTLAGFYHHQHISVWDIGCDHGHLGLSFLNHTQVQTIHLVDPSIEVIHVLKQKLVDSYITIPDSIKIHHQKGQKLILDSSLKTIFIAGMGGKEIQSILQNLIPQMNQDDRLVISPHRNILELRNFLNQSELGLLDELTLKEENQFYQVICLKRDQTLPKLSLYGEKLWQGPVGEEYRQHLIRAYQTHQNPLSRAFLSFLVGLSP